MDCVSPILSVLSNRLRDLFSVLFGHMISLEENIYTLRREMGELQGIRDDVKRDVDAAERQGLTCTNQVSWWLGRVDALGGETAQIDIQFQRLFRCFGDCPLNLYSRYHLGTRVAERLMEVRDLKGREYTTRRIADERVAGQIEEIPITSPVGMEAILKRLHECVKGCDVDIIGIHGMGGVGKTTLLKQLNNELLCSEHGFDTVIFLEITKDLNVEMIQRTIMSSLGLRWQENQDQREHSACMLRYLGTKKFIIMLDDIWEHLDLPSIGIPLPHRPHRRKIILTTRIQDICFQMDAQEVVKLECLPPPESWNLFELKTRKDFSNHPEMQLVARAIVIDCGGLPLALTTMGRAMESKQTVMEWRHAFATMINRPWELPGMNERVLAILKWSYDNLATDDLRQCFLYCSLYPQLFRFTNEMVTDCWLCEGFLGGISHLLSPFDRGDHIIGLLKAASLLESGEEGDEIRMHPMMRTLALWVASDFGRSVGRWLVQHGAYSKSAPELEKWHEAERISLMENEINTLPEAPDCPYLLTLMLSHNNGLRRLHDDFFRFMPCLKVLDLSHTSVEVLPASVGELRELRHLNLRQTKLVSLPSEVGNLTKLVHLDMNYSASLKFIPEGVVARLAPRLQMLGMFVTQTDWKVGGSSGDGVRFEELEDARQLNRFSISIGNVPALQRLYDYHHLPTKFLHLYGCEGMTSLVLPSVIGQKLRYIYALRISDSSDLEELVFGREDNEDRCVLDRLCRLEIINLAKAKIVCRGLLPPDALGRFPELQISSCVAIAQLIEGPTFAFAGVQKLLLQDLPMLTSICSEIAMIFPSLQILQVDRCPRLRKLPLGLSSDSYKLKSIRGQREWWDSLEWQDDFIKYSFQPIFKALE